MLFVEGAECGGSDRREYHARDRERRGDGGIRGDIEGTRDGWIARCCGRKVVAVVVAAVAIVSR